jgi:hypothetical protein
MPALNFNFNLRELYSQPVTSPHIPHDFAPCYCLFSMDDLSSYTDEQNENYEIFSNREPVCSDFERLVCFTDNIYSG